MIVGAQVTINGSRAAIWGAITDIENAPETVSGIEKSVFLSTMSISESSGGVTLTSSHDSRPQGVVASIASIPMPLFKSMMKKALQLDLNDIKSAVEQG